MERKGTRILVGFVGIQKKFSGRIPLNTHLSTYHNHALVAFTVQ